MAVVEGCENLLGQHSSQQHGEQHDPPTGQRAIGYFPRRYGVGFWEQAPAIAEPAMIRVGGAVARPLEVSVARLAELSIDAKGVASLAQPGQGLDKVKDWWDRFI